MRKNFLFNRVFVFAAVCAVLGSLLIGFITLTKGFSCVSEQQNAPMESEPIQYSVPQNH